MREIKFRAWDKVREEMAEVTNLDFNPVIVSLSTGTGREKDEFELMQYTGLKDKNGIEIYEGDILRDYDNELIGVVSFQDGAFIVSWENEFCNTFEWSSESVIGNIYENPELLETNP
ncbi:MAG: YopX family protein [Epsilonproteobacteria bacterium]|nr:YopX family protein [Campylobacterota bacterium]